ncbi:MAG TPA: GNAT family N-acetyltransferase [Deltaproteobacteria bacterium]|nr:GNAT family N-acetyltransferase [Deltaproteobacteria bacterium]
MNPEDISRYKASETLTNQQLLTIRAVRPNDKGLILETLVDVSPSSIYRRLFHYKNEITPEDWKMMTEVDFMDVVQLVATIEKEGREHIVGGGRYMRTGVSQEGQKAEVAMLVDDRHQGWGIGSRIFKHLVAIARASGITQFEAEILPSNRAMMKVFERSDLPVAKTVEEDYLYVSINLG